MDLYHYTDFYLNFESSVLIGQSVSMSPLRINHCASAPFNTYKFLLPFVSEYFVNILISINICNDKRKIKDLVFLVTEKISEHCAFKKHEVTHL